VVIPEERASEVIEVALAEVTGESHTREKLAKGAKLAEVFAKYGLL